MRIFRSFPYFISLCPRLLQTLLLEAPHRSTPTPAARSAAPINGRDCTKESLRNDLAIAGFQGLGVAKRYCGTIFNGNNSFARAENSERAEIYSNSELDRHLEQLSPSDSLHLDLPIAIPSLYPSFRTGIHWTVEDVRGQVGLGVNPGVREQSADGGSA